MLSLETFELSLQCAINLLCSLEAYVTGLRNEETFDEYIEKAKLLESKIGNSMTKDKEKSREKSYRREHNI